MTNTVHRVSSKLWYIFLVWLYRDQYGDVAIFLYTDALLILGFGYFVLPTLSLLV